MSFYDYYDENHTRIKRVVLIVSSFLFFFFFSLYLTQYEARQIFEAENVVRDCDIKVLIYTIRPIRLTLTNETQTVKCFHYLTTPDNIMIGEGPVPNQWILLTIFIISIVLLCVSFSYDNDD